MHFTHYRNVYWSVLLCEHSCAVLYCTVCLTLSSDLQCLHTYYMLYVVVCSSTWFCFMQHQAPGVSLDHFTVQLNQEYMVQKEKKGREASQ